MVEKGGPWPPLPTFGTFVVTCRLGNISLSTSFEKGGGGDKQGQIAREIQIKKEKNETSLRVERSDTKLQAQALGSEFRTFSLAW